MLIITLLLNLKNAHQSVPAELHYVPSMLVDQENCGFEEGGD